MKKILRSISIIVMMFSLITISYSVNANPLQEDPPGGIITPPLPPPPPPGK